MPNSDSHTFLSVEVSSRQMQNQNMNALKLKWCHLLTFKGWLLQQNQHFVHCMDCVKYKFSQRVADVRIMHKFWFCLIC